MRARSARHPPNDDDDFGTRETHCKFSFRFQWILFFIFSAFPWATFHRSHCKRIFIITIFFFFSYFRTYALSNLTFSSMRARARSSHIFWQQSATMMLDSWKLNFNFNSKSLVRHGWCERMLTIFNEAERRCQRKKTSSKWKKTKKNERKIFYIYFLVCVFEFRWKVENSVKKMSTCHSHSSGAVLFPALKRKANEWIHLYSYIY